MFQAEEKLVPKQQGLKDCGIVMPHGDFKGWGWRGRKGKEMTALVSILGLTQASWSPLKVSDVSMTKIRYSTIFA